MPPLQMPSPIVSVGWLAEHVDAPELVLFDASLQPAGAASAIQNDTTSTWLPGAQRFDFDERICDPATLLPHMLPSPELFTREVRALGVNQTSAIVVYDRVGVYSSPRAWWMFKAMGHERVSVLDGGLPAWLDAGLPVKRLAHTPSLPGDFVARPRPLFCDAEHVMAALGDERSAVLDARSEARFLGRESEPRAGLRSGHMPNARNLPFGAVQAGGRMRPADELAATFAAIVNGRRRLIFSCGSGVTACILALAADLAGYVDMAVYDGSWSEWGMPSARPVVAG